MSDEDLCYTSAIDLIQRFKTRELSPVDLMQAIINRSERVNPTINAFADQYFDRAIEKAKLAEARYRRGNTRALEGIPIVIKDETAIKGERTTHGSLLFRDRFDTVSAPIVQRIQRAGAIIHGRSTAPEFSCAAVCHSLLHGVTRNPWKPDFTPGGSSGGAAAQLAAGTTILANGSDIGGSIRIPASCSGIVGFKPPYGRVPQDPPFNLDTYCHDGPMARTVRDCALLENVIAGPSAKDIASLKPKLRIPEKFKPIKGWRIAYSVDLSYVEVDDDVRANLLSCMEVFRTLGAEVVEVEVGWSNKVLAGAMAHLTHIFGAYISEHYTRHRFDMSNYARAFASQSRRAHADDFMTALTIAGEMYQTFGPMLEKHNLFVCPTTAVPAVRAEHDPSSDKITVNGRDVDPMLGWVMTYPFNILSRCPVLSVPSGLSKDGIPTGIQLVGNTYDDISVFRAAVALEAERPWLDCPNRRPRL